MKLSDFNIYTIRIQFEFDEGFQWDTNTIDLIASNDNEALKFAHNACSNKHISKQDFKIVQIEIINTINLAKIYDSDGVLNYRT